MRRELSRDRYELFSSLRETRSGREREGERKRHSLSFSTRARREPIASENTGQLHLGTAGLETIRVSLDEVNRDH